MCAPRDLVWSRSRAEVPTAWRKLIHKRTSGFRFSKDPKVCLKKLVRNTSELHGLDPFLTSNPGVNFQ
jgi:hypothetical protein